MKIVHLYDGHERVYDGRGSVPTVVWNIARETAADGHDVTVVERQWDGLDETVTHQDVSFQRLPLSTGADEPWTRVPYEEVTSPMKALRLVSDRTNFARLAYSALRSLQPDIVHVHLPFAGAVLATATPWLRDRMVYTAHLGDLRMDLLDADAESDVDVPGILEIFSPDVYLAKRVAHTTVLNADIREAFLQNGLDESEVSVVPNGVDIDRFARPDADALREVRTRYGGTDRPLVLFVGTVMPRKGVLELVQAFETIAETVEQTPQLVIAGDDELDAKYVDKVKELICESTINSHVEMRGFVPGELLPALYHVADAVVVPSLEEGFGMTAIEAMAAGTPVVATRVGGLPRIIESGTHGRLVKPGDVSGLSGSLTDLLQSPELRAEMGERARKRAQEFAWSTVGTRFVSVYEEVAG